MDLRVIKGGIEGGRRPNEDDPFEVTVNRVLGFLIRDCEEFAIDMWSALANVEWRHNGGSAVLYSFRAAGDMIAAIRGHGDYLEWYCSGPVGLVSDFIEQEMAAEGWEARVLK